MRCANLVVLRVLAGCVAGFPAWGETDAASRSLQIYPKNLARQHLGANLFLFDVGTQSYIPTVAAAAWLDDDATTGSILPAGKQQYLLALPNPHGLTNFNVIAGGANGKVTLSVGDQVAVPGAASWSAVAKNVPIQEINQKKLSDPFSQIGKYVLIETDVAASAPLFGLGLFGDRPGVTYQLRKRAQPIDARGIFGPYFNDQTSFNLANLYSGARVQHANESGGYVAWQKAIDDNPQSSVTLAPSTTEPGAAVALGSRRAISRLAVLAESQRKDRVLLCV